MYNKIVNIKQSVLVTEITVKKHYYNKQKVVILPNSIGIVKDIIPLGGGFHKKNESNQFYYVIKFDCGTVSLNSTEFVNMN